MPSFHASSRVWLLLLLTWCGIGFGGGALAIDGRWIDSPPNPLAFCDQIYSTAGVGAGLTAVGGALLLSGAVLLALPPRRSPRPLPSLVPLHR